MRSWIGNGTVDFMVASIGLNLILLLCVYFSGDKSGQNLNPCWYKQLIKKADNNIIFRESDYEVQQLRCVRETIRQTST